MVEIFVGKMFPKCSRPRRFMVLGHFTPGNSGIRELNLLIKPYFTVLSFPFLEKTQDFGEHPSYVKTNLIHHACIALDSCTAGRYAALRLLPNTSVTGHHLCVGIPTHIPEMHCGRLSDVMHVDAKMT